MAPDFTIIRLHLDNVAQIVDGVCILVAITQDGGNAVESRHRPEVMLNDLLVCLHSLIRVAEGFGKGR
jgi:hypothetical protein